MSTRLHPERKPFMHLLSSATARDAIVAEVRARVVSRAGRLHADALRALDRALSLHSALLHPEGLSTESLGGSSPGARAPGRKTPSTVQGKARCPGPPQ
ncbi:MAG: hypothetical protein A2V77_20635 [Anaeromyxobacter sp. RBG_16_69_14]|nr:MAG: hypothetical protein A2V77_20635 [Anaeromyxobacter sp. RBG_16_69_14]